jgi:hypothetical protein
MALPPSPDCGETSRLRTMRPGPDPPPLRKSVLRPAVSGTHFFMNPDQDRMAKMVIQTLQNWGIHLGAAAWVIFGVLLLAGLATMLFLARWIWRGGLSRQTGLGFFQRDRVADESLLRDL